MRREAVASPGLSSTRRLHHLQHFMEKAHPDSSLYTLQPRISRYAGLDASPDVKLPPLDAIQRADTVSLADASGPAVRVFSGEKHTFARNPSGELEGNYILHAQHNVGSAQVQDDASPPGLIYCSRNVGRPQEALDHLKPEVERRVTTIKEAWLADPIVFIHYGEALTRVKRDDKQAKMILERVLKNPNLPFDHVLLCRVRFSQVLRRLEQVEKAKEHEVWAVKWFKKNPNLFTDVTLRRLLLAEDGSPTDILEGLGGLRWFDTRKRTEKTDRNLTKMCYKCFAREPTKRLFRCSNCHIYYCSRECQRIDWPRHKQSCLDNSMTNERIQELTSSDPEAAQRWVDWKHWRVNYVEGYELVHALGLHRDRSRCRTHIVAKVVEYRPNATKKSLKFHVIQCGVFRITDFMPELERLMGLNEGEGKEYIDDVSGASGRGGELRMPILDLSWGNGIQAWLGGRSFTTNVLHNNPYDPDWRRLINPDGQPPLPLQFPGQDLRDAEYIFDN
ncbi:hypothetical protein JAAARDRAFT_80540 [Jaapia argillacea MUCL 33604]|uniref:MYND-type domain-containing protein n=1 Tax=Jaapia argillacea MUCL 33604 TaxID=933084 RepID=A0A067PQR9_9AGAM|nr:hypothetical protein JAAARDRAFT_80540 [Jaapia argillacea MUCL 33604]